MGKGKSSNQRWIQKEGKERPRGRRMERGESSNQRPRSRSPIETRLPTAPGNRKFSVKFGWNEITTVVTCFPDVIDTWVRETEKLLNPNASRPQIVGLAIQDPDYVFFHPLFPITCSRPHVLTICVGKRCLMIQLPNTWCVPENLRRFLTDSNKRFVGYNNFFDPEKLYYHTGHGLVLPVQNCRNIRSYVFGISYRRNLLDDNLEFLRKGYHKLMQEVDSWRETGVFSPDLCKRQVQYCTVQAYVYYKLGIDFCMAGYP